MIQAYEPGTPGASPKSKGTSTPIGALTAVTGVFSARKEKQTIAQLTAENEELKKLERLRPQLMELQQKVETLQKAATDAEKQHTEEYASILEDNNELATVLKQAQRNAEKSNTDKDDALALANEWSAKAEKAEREVRRLHEEVDDLKEQLAEAASQSIDPIVVDQLNEKIVDLESEFFFCCYCNYLFLLFTPAVQRKTSIGSVWLKIYLKTFKSCRAPRTQFI